MPLLACLQLDVLQPVKAKKDSFADLELPPGLKNTVQGLVQTKLRDDESTETADESQEFDLVRGKGEAMKLMPKFNPYLMMLP